MLPELCRLELSWTPRSLSLTRSSPPPRSGIKWVRCCPRNRMQPLVRFPVMYVVQHDTSAYPDGYFEFFIPSVRVFTRRDMVPFFLQLRGTSSSMLALYSPGNKSEEGLARRLLRMAHTTTSAPQISVSIKRQVVLNTDGTEVARSYTIGSGSMRPVPPGYVPPGSESDLITMDYEGEIQFASHVTVGGFDVGKVRISVSVLHTGILSISAHVDSTDRTSSFYPSSLRWVQQTSSRV